MYSPSVRELSIPPVPAFLKWAGLAGFLILAPTLYSSLVPNLDDLRVIMALVLLTALTAALASARGGLIVDDGRGTLTKWWGLIIPIKRNTYPLSRITNVQLLKKVVLTGKGARVTYPVVLIQQNADMVNLAEEIDYPNGRRKAEAVARFLRINLHDDTSGESIVREHQYLDEPIVQRYHRLGLQAPFREPPPGAVVRIRAAEAGNPLMMEIPATGFQRGHLVLLLILLGMPLLIILIIATVQFRDSDSGYGLTLLFTALFSPWLIGALLLVVNVATAREIISVSPDEIKIETLSRVRHSSKRIAADKIEEIAMAVFEDKSTGSKKTNIDKVLAYSVGGHAIQIRTDLGITGISHWLPEAELLWLRDMLLHGLVGDRLTPFAPRTTYAPTVSPAFPQSRTSRTQWLSLILAAGALILVILQSGIPQKAGKQSRSEGDHYVMPSGPILSGYELMPGAGSGYIQIYGRGIQTGSNGPDLRIAIDEVRLAPAGGQNNIAFRNLALSVHLREGDNWQLVGSAQQDAIQSILKEGDSYLYPNTQEFIIKGATAPCQRGSCYFRLHILGQVGSGRPGWDVTEFMPLKAFTSDR